jgi:hypothetical protein|tara:strand:+ start:741 stop:986 length:246 start_codon:yes stop_codon:yes gene_type:complete
MTNKVFIPMTMDEEYQNADVPQPRGPNDLEAVIERLEFKNKVLHQHVDKLTEELLEVRVDNKKLTKQIEEQIKQFRNKGAL